MVSVTADKKRNEMKREETNETMTETALPVDGLGLLRKGEWAWKAQN